MRVIVFSDSHGKLDWALKALEESGPVDLLLHAGDYYLDGLKLGNAAGVPARAVRGNTDGQNQGALEELVEIEGQRILLTHGHQPRPGREYEHLKTRAAELDACMVIFGHTHRAELIRSGKVIFFNPGSIARPRDQSRPSYGIVEADQTGIRPSIKRI